MPNSRPTLDVLTVGEPMAEYTSGNGDDLKLAVGGDVLNVAVAVSRLGGRAGIACRLGADDPGRHVLQFLKDERVQLEAVSVDDQGFTGSYSIRYDSSGHAFSYQRAGSAASHWGVADAEALDMNKATFVHFSGITQAISESSEAGCDVLLERATAASTGISYDPNYRPQLWSVDKARGALHKVLRYQPVLLPGLEDARLLTGLENAHEIVRYFVENGAALVAMTAGADGVYLAEGPEVAHIPGVPSNCVDASGAGDCFDGAFLSQIAKGRDPKTAAIFANTAASISVTRHGAAASIPTVSDL